MNTKNLPKEKPAAPQPLYQLSTQFRNWRFSQSGLEQARQELNEGAVGRVKSKLEEQRNVEAPSVGGGPAEPSQIEYLTVQDELELVTFYLTKISQLSRDSMFAFPETVEATAMSYLKRFYLRNTCMDYHPKNIMLTCLFLATKTENTSISIKKFAWRIPKTTDKDVLDFEFLVAQSLKFQFKVHHAHVAARGIYLDLQNLQPNPIAVDTLLKAWPQVCGLLRTARLTDAEFLWTPSQIATGAWWIADRAATEAWLNAKSNRLPKTNENPTPALELKKLMDNINSLADILIQAQSKPIDKERVTAVDRRLRFCRNPEKDPNSALYKIKQAELETSNVAKHKEKYASQSNKDPFA